LSENPVVGVVMGSDSDWPVMSAAAEALDEFEVPYEADVVSAHRMPHEMIEYGSSAERRGLRVIIAGAGGAAHLPGMLASVTPLPVIGVPVPLANLSGLDSLLSIVQMPAGIPVATVAVGGARNAGLLAVRILAAGDPVLQQKMTDFQAELAINPGHAATYYKLADAYSRVQKFDEAERLLQRSIWLDSTSTGAYILLGKVLEKKGEAELAARALQHALSVDPNNSVAHHLLGQAYQDMGRTADAERERRASQQLQDVQNAKPD